MFTYLHRLMLRKYVTRKFYLFLTLEKRRVASHVSPQESRLRLEANTMLSYKEYPYVLRELLYKS